jgi:RNA polymerase sigma-70 factor (ECF subfamily)
MQEGTCVLREAREVSPDQRIAEAVLEGNPQAYNQLIERYWSRIFARVFQLLGNREDAEEVTQDAFNKAYENLGTFRWEASFSTWLYQIASNLARNRYWYWKRRRRERSISLETPLTDDGGTLADILEEEGTSPADALVWEEFHGKLVHQLEQLPPRHGEVLSMRLVEELSYEAMGTRMGVPVGTVKSRISRARQCLLRSMGYGEDAKIQGAWS